MRTGQRPLLKRPPLNRRRTVDVAPVATVSGRPAEVFMADAVGLLPAVRISTCLDVKLAQIWYPLMGT